MLYRIVLVWLFAALAPASAAPSLLGLPEVPVPAANPQSAAKIALGKRLFEDARFSADGSISCASCHQAARAFSDGLPRAHGIGGQEGPRNTPSAFNAAYYTRLFLDGRRPSLETQSLDPLLNPIEHGLPDHDAMVAIITADGDYRRQFAEAFPGDPAPIRAERVGQAIASFERTLVGGGSAFDRYFFGADKSALSASAIRGLDIFRRKGNCANCHEISWDHALFTDNRFYNLGVGYQRLEGSVEAYVRRYEDARRRGGPLPEADFSPIQRSELGRFNVTGRVEDIGKFRTPGLRNVALTAPYMHDGSLATLAEVIEYYDRGGHDNPRLDPAIFPLHLSEREKQDLLALLRALTTPPWAE